MTDLIITHKFNFQDEEIMAYFISLLKTLSSKLNQDTIAFFFNQNNRDFALYIEALKFFDHGENMVRAAVQMIVLTIFRIKYEPVLTFIYSRTSVPYFSHLAYYLGSNDISISRLIRKHRSEIIKAKDHLRAMLSQTLDILHYLNDILMLKIQDLNDVLVDQLLHRLLIPLHLYSLTKRSAHNSSCSDNPRRSTLVPAVSMFILAQLYSILEHPDLIQLITEALFIGDLTLTCFTGGVSPPRPTQSREDSARPQKQSPSNEELENEFEYDLSCASLALRSSRSAPAGMKLQAYAEHALNISLPSSPVKGTNFKALPRFPLFQKPTESLGDILKRTTRIRQIELPTALLTNTVSARNRSSLNLGEESPLDREFRAVAERIVKAENSSVSPNSTPCICSLELVI
ncbi:hypothetical protein Ciccas_007741 [Cichlidogyrus casuarinus]|uniref:Uncharacterized protein n=1 Tax=Cichlidogyrus casuarinus TaxID=1844966 RepID=A0ABD2Q358_9PLAT